MSLFVCSECNCIENSGASNYFIRKLEGEPPLCSECDSEIGEWHNLFPKIEAVPNEAHETTIKRAFEAKESA